MLQQLRPLFGASPALLAESPPASSKSRRIGFAPLPSETFSPVTSAAEFSVRSRSSDSASVEHFRAIDEITHVLLRASSCTLPTAAFDEHITPENMSRSASLSSITFPALEQPKEVPQCWEEATSYTVTPSGVADDTYSISPLPCSPHRNGMRKSLRFSPKRRLALRLPSRRASPQTLPNRVLPSPTASEAPTATTRSVLWQRLRRPSSIRPSAALLSFEAAAAACGAAATLAALRGNGITTKVAVTEGRAAVVAEASVKLQLVKARRAQGNEIEVAHEPLLILESARRGTKRGLVLDANRQATRDPAAVLKMLEDLEPANSETADTLNALITWARRGVTRRVFNTPPAAVSTDNEFYIAMIPVKNAASGCVLMLLSSHKEADEFCEAFGVLQTYSEVYGCPTIAAAAAKTHKS